MPIAILGLYRSGSKCDEACAHGAPERRLGCNDYALSRLGSHWTQGWADKVRFVEVWMVTYWNSPNMIPKHMEMDAVVRSIFEAISKLPHLSSTLFVLCGDHGMNEAGNHGGAGPGETSTALLFMSPKLRSLSPAGRKCPVSPTGPYEFYSKIDQSDMAPTISSLLGLPIPRNNVGVILPEFLGLWDDGESGILLAA
jgi:arylsulfatase A-like enzyme